MFRFDHCTFDPDTGELAGTRETVRLQPKPARLLALLLEAGGELVERERIREALWPDTNVDFDAGLNTCMRQIRTALIECGGAAECIETLPKRGYRLAVAVDGKRAGATAASPGASESVLRTGSLIWRPHLAIWVVLAAGAVIALGWALMGRGELPPSESGVEAVTTDGGADARSERPARPARLAVVPFVDPDSDDQDAFNRDLTEAFVTALVDAAPDDIVVIGPSTTSQYFSEGASLADLASAVGADFVLHGGHRSGADIVFVEVVWPDGAHLFAQRMELDLTQPARAPAEAVAAMTAAIVEARRQR